MFYAKDKLLYVSVEDFQFTGEIRPTGPFRLVCERPSVKDVPPHDRRIELPRR